jgi:hypothetical protein
VGPKIEKEAENTPNSGKVEWFLQGTLYPDVYVFNAWVTRRSRLTGDFSIESLSFRGPSATIKSKQGIGIFRCRCGLLHTCASRMCNGTQEKVLTMRQPTTTLAVFLR